uniref:Large ribosomal subunit protein bL34m n=1 Tax=Astyanax mexicanus TaxID=7994 RepID=A0A8B9HX88_ASTMX
MFTVLCFRIRGGTSACSGLRSFSSWLPFTERRPAGCRTVGDGVSQIPSWHCQQVRTKKRGMEYQPNNIKRKRTHGWIKRISTQGGIEVILRRMLKGRRSLSH